MFYKLPVSNVVKETEDAVSISFSVPDELEDEFEYLAGQFLTIKANIDGEEVRRAYSLCSSPVEDLHLSVATKRVQGGKMSNWLNDNVKVGDELEVMAPQGKFFVETKPSNKNTYVLFAGGSGITPMLSILRAILKEEPGSKILLVYANRDEKSIIFKDQIEKLNKRYAGKFNVLHILEEGDGSYCHYTGRINLDIIADILQKSVGMMSLFAKYYVCGPTPMMDVVLEGLEKKKINKKNIFQEKFTASDSTKEIKEITEKVSSDKVTATISLDGKKKTFELRTGVDILTSVMEAGMDPPYACQIGACSTCKAKVISGSAKMIEREALTDEEITEGYILTCQAHPTSSEIEIDYNV